MTKNHNNYLDLAFYLAEKNLGLTKYNPSIPTEIIINEYEISYTVTTSREKTNYSADTASWILFKW